MWIDEKYKAMIKITYTPITYKIPVKVINRSLWFKNGEILDDDDDE